MKKIAIIIVNWNGYPDTIDCLSSVAKLKRGQTEIQTIVVDNGSTNDSVVRISHAHPWATILTLPDNRGFTGGNNVGIKYAMLYGADYIWLLNNDTVLDPAAADLINAFRKSGVGVAGSKIYFAAGREYHAEKYQKKDVGNVLWYGGGQIDWDNMYASHRAVDDVDRGQYDTETETPFVTGCSMMIAREVIDKIGMLDDRFYLYLEDLDFCLRAKRAGFRLMYFPKSVLWHRNAGSSGGSGSTLHDYYMTRNRLIIGLRYAPMRTKFALLREAFGFLSGTNSVKSRAVRDFFSGRWGRRHE